MRQDCRESIALGNCQQKMFDSGCRSGWPPMKTSGLLDITASLKTDRFFPPFAGIPPGARPNTQSSTPRPQTWLSWRQTTDRAAGLKSIAFSSLAGLPPRARPLGPLTTQLVPRGPCCAPAAHGSTISSKALSLGPKPRASSCTHHCNCWRTTLADRKDSVVPKREFFLPDQQGPPVKSLHL